MGTDTHVFSCAYSVSREGYRFILVTEVTAVTAMTLMTVICRGFLDGGGGYVFHRRWISSIVQSLESGMCSTGFCGGHRCHHRHHFWERVSTYGGDTSESLVVCVCGVD